MKPRTTLVTVLSAVALLGGLLVPAHADGGLKDKQHHVHQQVQAAQSDLEGASKRLQAAAAALQRTRSQLPQARAALADVQARKQAAQEQLVAIRQQLAQLRAQQRLLQSQIDAAQARIDTSEQMMGEIVRFQYQSRGLVELQVVLSADNASDFMQRLLTTQQVLDQQNQVVDQLTADQAVLAARQQQMQVNVDSIRGAQQQAFDTVQHLKDLTQQARATEQHIAALAKQRAHALQVARQQKAAEMARLQRLKRAEQRLAAQIQASTSSSGGTMPTGQLLWPTPGPMVQGVGWRVHPVYGYLSCHTGIDIAAPTGQPIVAAADGVVVWTNPDLSGPYGNNTLIDDGGGLSTFYAHQSAFNVSPGQTVKAGQVIGYVGETGYATGPHLHFEVHINGVPYDPMGWFGGTKTPQSQFCP